MPVRIAVMRTTGQGETFQADICQWNPVTGSIAHKTVAEMQELIDDVFQISDVRLMEMNTRMLEAYNFQQYFDDVTWSKIVSILEVLSGRTTPDQVIKLWTSAQEETADLERIRRQHYQEQQQAAHHEYVITQSRICECTGNGHVPDCILYKHSGK